MARYAYGRRFTVLWTFDGSGGSSRTEWRAMGNKVYKAVLQLSARQYSRNAEAKQGKAATRLRSAVRCANGINGVFLFEMDHSPEAQIKLHAACALAHVLTRRSHRIFTESAPSLPRAGRSTALQNWARRPL